MEKTIFQEMEKMISKLETCRFADSDNCIPPLDELLFALAPDMYEKFLAEKAIAMYKVACNSIRDTRAGKKNLQYINDTLEEFIKALPDSYMGITVLQISPYHNQVGTMYFGRKIDFMWMYERKK